MIDLSNLENTTRLEKKSKRLGRGTGSHKGKTCGRGQKGGGSRAGYRRRWGNEGGQLELFRKLPCKGFSNMPFKMTYDVINLDKIDQIFEEGETVNQETLCERGYLSPSSKNRVKILGDGTLTKKVTIEVDAISANALEKLKQMNIEFTISQLPE